RRAVEHHRLARAASDVVARARGGRRQEETRDIPSGRSVPSPPPPLRGVSETKYSQWPPSSRRQPGSTPMSPGPASGPIRNSLKQQSATSASSRSSHSIWSPTCPDNNTLSLPDALPISACCRTPPPSSRRQRRRGPRARGATTRGNAGHSFWSFSAVPATTSTGSERNQIQSVATVLAPPAWVDTDVAGSSVRPDPEFAKTAIGDVGQQPVEPFYLEPDMSRQQHSFPTRRSSDLGVLSNTTA